MVYIKSALIGALTGGTAMVTSTILWMIIAAYQIRGQFPHGEIGFDLRSMLGRPSLIWLATIAGFIAGFYWRYRVILSRIKIYAACTTRHERFF